MTPEERDEILARIDEIQKFIAMTVEEKKEYIAEMNRLGMNPPLTEKPQ